LQWQFTTSEWKLARQLYAQPGDVVVADSAYGTYVDLALVHSANADAVFGNIMRVTVIFVGARSWALAIILSNGSVLMSSINASRRLWSITSKHRSAGSPFIDSTTGVSTHRNHLVTTLVDPKRYPKAKLAHLYQLLASNGSEFQASQNDFEDGDDFAKTRKWCRKKFGCICLRTTCCEA